MVSFRLGCGMLICRCTARPGHAMQLVSAEQGVKYAVTDGARQRLLDLLDDQESTAPKREGKAAAIEVSRLTKEELGSRLVPLAGIYQETDAQVCIQLDKGLPIMDMHIAPRVGEVVSMCTTMRRVCSHSAWL